MAAQAGLAIAANAFAPIGLADVVFRAGKDVLELFLKVRDAPKGLALALSAVRIVENAIAEASLYLTELSASDFVHEDHVAIPDITFILQNCHAEFNKLGNITKAASATPNDGWSLLWKRRTVFTLNDKEIERSQRRLHRYAQALTTTLSVAKGRNQILLRNQLSSTRSDMVKASDNVLQHVAISEQVISSSVTKAAQDAKAEISASLDNMQDIVQMQTADSRAQHRQGLASIHKGFQRNRLRQSVAMNQQLREIKRHGRQLKQIHQTVMSSMTIIESTNNSIQFVGFNTEELLLPLLLVKSQLAKVIPTLSQLNKISISSAELHWLREALNGLIADASFSLHHGDKKTFILRSRASPSRRRQVHTSIGHEDAATLSSASRHVWGDAHALETAIGTLVVNVHRSNGPIMTTTINFAFTPRLEVCNTGFHTVFMQQPYMPRALKKLHVYRVLSHEHKVFDIIENEDTLALQDLLRRQDVSLFDCSTEGLSLALWAFRRMRPKSFGFLLDQGARVENYSSSTRSLHFEIDVNRIHLFLKDWHDMIPRATRAGFCVPRINTLEIPSLDYANHLIRSQSRGRRLRSLVRVRSLPNFKSIAGKKWSFSEQIGQRSISACSLYSPSVCSLYSPSACSLYEPPLQPNQMISDRRHLYSGPEMLFETLTQFLDYVGRRLNLLTGIRKLEFHSLDSQSRCDSVLETGGSSAFNVIRAYFQICELVGMTVEARFMRYLLAELESFASRITPDEIDPLEHFMDYFPINVSGPETLEKDVRQASVQCWRNFGA